MRDDSNGEILFVIRDLENKFHIFNRNNNFVTEITILPFFQKLEFLRSYSKNLGIVPVKTPIDVNLHLSKNTGENKAQNEYASILSSLMYIMNCTRPDIACAVRKLS